MAEKDMLEGGKAFFLQGTGREAVLCLHGFTGSPGVYRKLARHLHQLGYSVSVPCLPGHGTVPEDLLTISNEQYLAACRRFFDELAGQYERVHLVGLSLGGTLSTLLAAELGERSVLGSVSLFSPGYGLNRALTARLGLDSGADLSRLGGMMIPLPGRNPSGDEMDECLFAYHAVPLLSFAKLQGLNLEAGKARPAVKAPVMLLYAGHDAIVDAEISAASAGTFKQLEVFVSYDNSEHNLLLGQDWQDVVTKCGAFIQVHGLHG